MRAQHILAAAAGLILLAVSGGRTLAADDLSWGLAPTEMLRYELDAEPVQRDAGAPSLWGQEPDRARVVRADDFERGRRYKAEGTSIGDVVWFYALSLPDGALAGKRGAAPVDEMHARAGLLVKGQDEYALEEGVVKLKATLSVETSPPPQANGYGYVAGTTLVVVRSFDPASRRVTEASYALEARQVMSGKSFAWRMSGKIACAGPVDTGAREFLAQVERAIKRGAGALKKDLDQHIATRRNPANGAANAQGSYALGYAALATFALLRSGVPREELADAFVFMESCPWTEVYSVSLYLMCMEAKHVRRLAVPPEAGGHTVSRYEKDPVPDADKAVMSKAAEWLIAARMRGAWTYHPPKGGVIAGGDRSNSQFAVLALHVAVTSGVKLDPQVFMDVADEIVGAQEAKGPARTLRGCTFTASAPRGLLPGSKGGGGLTGMREVPVEAQERGWAYGMVTKCVAGQAYGSMSAAGVSSAVIAREALRRAGRLDPERDEKTRRAILDGIAWLARHFTPSRNPGNAGFVECFYWLYSLEKAMELSGCESLAGHDWWLEGAAQLLTQQKGGGDFGNSTISDTSLALLFLNRATLPTRIAVEARPVVSSGKDDPSAWDLVKVDGLGFVHVGQVLDALAAAAPDDAKDILRVAERAFDELPEEVRPRLVPKLARIARGEGQAARGFAKKALKSATGGIDDPTKAETFHARWEAAVKAGESADYAAIPSLAGAVEAKEATPVLKRAALVSLSRLRAVEALPGLLEELASGDAAWRLEVYTAVVSIAGGGKRPFDPAASAAERTRQLDGWRAWWKDEGPALTVAEEARRKAAR